MKKFLITAMIALASVTAMDDSFARAGGGSSVGRSSSSSFSRPSTPAPRPSYTAPAAPRYSAPPTPRYTAPPTAPRYVPPAPVARYNQPQTSPLGQVPQQNYGNGNYGNNNGMSFGKTAAATGLGVGAGIIGANILTNALTPKAPAAPVVVQAAPVAPQGYTQNIPQNVQQNSQYEPGGMGPAGTSQVPQQNYQQGYVQQQPVVIQQQAEPKGFSDGFLSFVWGTIKFLFGLAILGGIAFGIYMLVKKFFPKLTTPSRSDELKFGSVADAFVPKSQKLKLINDTTVHLYQHSPATFFYKLQQATMDNDKETLQKLCNADMLLMLEDNPENGRSAKITLKNLTYEFGENEVQFAFFDTVENKICLEVWSFNIEGKLEGITVL